jgi:hypothetical protein
VNHEKTLSIPQSERIQGLLLRPNGREEVLTAIAAALSSAFLNLNLKVPMNEDQIVELSDAIIDSSSEDNLALEDVLLFLRDMLMGKHGKLFERLDMQVFFEKFEEYRQERHEKLCTIREERESQHKHMGRGNERKLPMSANEDASTVLSLMQDLYSKPEE